MYKVAPLPGTFMMTSMIGFFISIMYINTLSKSWGFAFTLLFVLMFISSVISMTKADAAEELKMDEMAFHYKE